MAVTMNSFWDSIGTVIPGGDAEYVVAEQPIAEYDNWFNYNVVADIQAVIDDVINKFNANTILKADTDNTPAALVVAEQTIVGRKTGNSIAALIDSEVLAIIGVEPGATADQTNTEIRDAVEAATDSNTFTDADHTKLNGVEALATTDQTNSEIRTAVEAATDSNVFTDADHTKLNGIEALADVTDTTNVAASGATMESLFDANTILKADSNDTPAALTVAEQTLVGRITAGVITALTASQVRTLIGVAHPSTITDVKASRSVGTAYQNTSAKSMMYVHIEIYHTSSVDFDIYVGSTNTPTISLASSVLPSGIYTGFFVAVPPGWWYKPVGSYTTVGVWTELSE